MPAPSSNPLQLLPRGWPRRWRALLCTAVCLLAIYYFAGLLNHTYPLDRWLFWRLGLVWLWCVVLNLVWLAFGALLTSKIVGQYALPPLEAAVTSVTVGVVGMGLLLYVAGFLGLLRPWLVLPLAAVLLAFGARPLGQLGRRIRAELGAMPRPRTLFGHALTWVTIGWAVWCLTFLYLGAMTPAAINHDAAWYHLPIAADYVRAGRIVPFVADYLRAVPHLMSVLYTWVFLVPGLSPAALRWMLALHIEFSMVLWTLVGVAAGARWMLAGRRVPLLWVCFLLFPGIYIYDMNIGGSADHFLGAFTVPFFLATVRAARRFDTRRCLLLAVLAGGAVLTKYHALFLLAGSAAILIPRWGWLVGKRLRRLSRNSSCQSRRDAQSGALLRGPAIIVLVGLVLTAPHFVKNIVFYHNPIYPFPQELFTASWPRHENAVRMVKGMITDAAGLPEGTLSQRLLEAVRVFFTFSFEPHYTFIGSTPVFGSLFTLLLPLALLVVWRRRIWLGVWMVFVGMLMWGITQFADRYLQILSPLMAVVVAALLVRAWQLGNLARLGVVPLVLLQVVWGGDAPFINAAPRIESSITLIRSGFKRQYKERARFPWRRSEQQLGKALPPDAVLMLHSTNMNLAMDRPVLLDVVGKQGLVDYDEVADPRGMWELYRSLGVTHLAYLAGVPSTYNRAHDVLFVDFVTRYGIEQGRFGPWRLVIVPDRAPPPERPYQVLTLGINYRDGLYRVEQMRVHEAMQPVPDPLPAPLVVLPHAVDDQVALLLRANAVVVAARHLPAPAVEEALTEKFRQGALYPRRFAIWVRR